MSNIPDNIYYEDIHETFGGHIVRSTPRKPTPDEIAEAQRQHGAGKCGHTLIYDKRGWLYDERYCAVCGNLIVR